MELSYRIVNRKTLIKNCLYTKVISDNVLLLTLTMENISIYLCIFNTCITIITPIYSLSTSPFYNMSTLVLLHFKQINNSHHNLDKAKINLKKFQDAIIWTLFDISVTEMLL
ncbi:hypothetical protein KUTeg_014431 [Tegillarca granosa]|uniref:Uncharacterized protein n=1 Tax=Tegillarca granosa TaxID=220873 RepID=A0ABQ9EZZ2_TEGGR|nr:hypothetical protein KUTeg_014431 [Tegillarca granosa]